MLVVTHLTVVQPAEDEAVLRECAPGATVRHVIATVAVPATLLRRVSEMRQGPIRPVVDTETAAIKAAAPTRRKGKTE
jgi:hypothetical protein